MIRVLLADDHGIVRAGLKRLIDGAGDMEVVAEASDGREAIDMAHDTRPDVAVVDISMPGLDGLEVVSRLGGYYPDMPVLILTMHEEEQYVVRAISSGARGYVTKRSVAEQLLTAIRKVHDGGRYIDEAAAESLASHHARSVRGRSPVDTLSDREIQVLRNLASGKTNREIADIYNISVKTVDTYRSRLLKKLDLKNNAELTRFALKSGLIE